MVRQLFYKTAKPFTMKKIITLIAVPLVFIVTGCTKNALTGKSYVSLISESQLQEMAVSEYRQFLSQSKVLSASANKDAEMVKRVGTRLAAAAKQYMDSIGAGDKLKGYQWEFNLVDNNQVNAWCMPGGKVVVYTGLLPVAQNEAALAIVLGHEIIHAVAEHGGQRMNNTLIAQGLGTLGDALTSRNPKVNSIFNNVYAPGVQVGLLLPNSRTHELEADKFGLFIAAMAGYNPREAIPFWTRMSQSGGQKPPEFLATHPSDERRIAQLESYMPQALKLYRPVRK